MSSSLNNSQKMFNVDSTFLVDSTALPNDVINNCCCIYIVNRIIFCRVDRLNESAIINIITSVFFLSIRCITLKSVFY